jgi:hypothetical protein
VDVDWADLTFRVTQGPGKCIGGAASLDGRIYVLTREGDSHVAQAFEVEKRQWSPIGLEGQGPHAGEYVGVPIVDAARNRIHWIGASGRFTLVCEKSRSALRWRPWETDAHPCHALPHYGPPYLDRVRNRYWQLCFDDHDQTYRFYEIEGEESTDKHDDMEGDLLTTGDASFSKKYDYWEAPWDAPGGEAAQSIRIPLLQLCGNDKRSAVVVTRLMSEHLISELFHERQNDAHLLTFSVESRNELPVPLKVNELLKSKRPWECKAFLFENCLHIYVPDRLKCYRWSFDTADSQSWEQR